MSRIHQFSTVVPVSVHKGTVFILFGTIAALLLAHSIYKSWSRLRHIPGPPGTGLSKWWMFRNAMGGSMHLALKEAVDKYGELRRRLTPLVLCLHVTLVSVRGPNSWR